MYVVDEFGYQEDYLDLVIEETLKKESAEDSILSVILVDEKTIQEINKEYRKKDAITDVISFAFEDTFSGIPEEIRVLGDIYICIPRMREQAVLYGHSEKRELAFLCVHGLLHLLGYDHMNQRDEKVMFQKQDEILNHLDIRI